MTTNERDGDAAADEPIRVETRQQFDEAVAELFRTGRPLPRCHDPFRLAVSGTWPMRTEASSRMLGQGTNVLVSSIVLVCRRCLANAPAATRPEFLDGSSGVGAGAAPPPNRQRRPGRSRPGVDRPKHGRLHRYAPSDLRRADCGIERNRQAPGVRRYRRRPPYLKPRPCAR